MLDAQMATVDEVVHLVGVVTGSAATFTSREVQSARTAVRVGPAPVRCLARCCSCSRCPFRALPAWSRTQQASMPSTPHTSGPSISARYVSAWSASPSVDGEGGHAHRPGLQVDDSVYDALRNAMIRLIRPNSSAGPVYFVLHDVDGERRASELAAALHAALYADLVPLARAVPATSA
ncbi:hypothetical protein ACWCV9_36160 [Streptomyces sp. NPDC001606]